MRRLVFFCVVLLLASPSFANPNTETDSIVIDEPNFAWAIPDDVKHLIIGSFEAQNDAAFMNVTVSEGQPCLVYSDGTSVNILEDRGGDYLVNLNASLVFKEHGSAGDRVNLYDDFRLENNDLCPRNTHILINKDRLKKLHSKKKLFVQDFFDAERAQAREAELRSVGVPESVVEALYGYYEALNDARERKNYVNKGDKCAVLNRGGELTVRSRNADETVDVMYEQSLVFMYKNHRGAMKSGNLYSAYRDGNTDICPSHTVIRMPIADYEELDDLMKRR